MGEKKSPLTKLGGLYIENPPCGLTRRNSSSSPLYKVDKIFMGVTADTASCVARENGFRQAFEGTDFTLADTVFMQDDAGNITSTVNEGLSQNYAGFLVPMKALL